MLKVFENKDGNCSVFRNNQSSGTSPMPSKETNNNGQCMFDNLSRPSYSGNNPLQDWNRST